ncbi:MAG: HlyD family efflux transporter periplasmic adaptor subunit [Desulfobacterales bacterium]|nr:HlyD family efflux transporter periplasmic adaptor subunit [Desulfobacterales bacterium]
MQKGPLFKSIRVIVVIACALVVALVLVALRPKAQRQLPPQTGRLVEVISVQPRTVTMPVKAFGTVRPREKLLLVAEVNGEISSMDARFAEGNCVDQNTVLAVIDPIPYALEVERSRGQVERVGAQIEKLAQDVKNLNVNLAITSKDMLLAENEFKRLEDLYKSKVSSRTNRDRAEQGYLASRAKRQAIENQLALIGPIRAGLESERKIARAGLHQAQYNLERTKIWAPFGGWVLEKKIETGQHVNAGQYLGNIYKANSLDVEVSVPLPELRWLKNGGQGPSEFRVDIRFPGNSAGPKWAGKLVRIMAGLDEMTRMQRFVVEIENDAKVVGLCPGKVDLDGLRPGMFVEVEIQGRQIDTVFKLPRYVVQADDTVFVAVGDKLVVKPVRVIRRLGETIFIESGITANDLIIKTPLAGISGGEKIRIKK